jgi:hypothetical protein
MRLSKQTMKDIDRAFKALDALEEIKSEIESNINQLHENGERHAEFVRNNGNYIAEGLELALQIINYHMEEI